MEKEFIPYELALRMKQIRFDEVCFGYWYTAQEEYKKIDIQVISDFDLLGETDYILAPTYSQAFRWFDYSTEWSGFIVPSKEEGCFDWLSLIHI